MFAIVMRIDSGALIRSACESSQLSELFVVKFTTSSSVDYTSTIYPRQGVLASLSLSGNDSETAFKTKFNELDMLRQSLQPIPNDTSQGNPKKGKTFRYYKAICMNNENVSQIEKHFPRSL